ncbi:MAG: hypothetical protein AB8G17_03440 [Gammaproteobacteria bacterium]
MRLVTIWAGTATLIAVGALGYIAGKAADADPAPSRYSVSHVQTQPSKAEDPAREVPTPYVIPDHFANLPTEWRTAVTPSAVGYAALFDPQRRELIVEQCEHPGYKLNASGEALPITNDICQPVLWSKIATLDDTEALVIHRGGGADRIEIELVNAQDKRTLQVRFADQAVTMIPGSKNDLVVAMEQTPTITRQKAAYHRAMMADRSSARAVGQAAQRPTFTVPASAVSALADKTP